MNVPTDTDFNRVISDLENQIKQATESRQWAERERENQLHTDLANHESQAVSYRTQAAKALTDADKLTLFRFADLEDSSAEKIRIELGINVKPDVREKSKTIQRFTDVLRRLSLFTAGWLSLFFVADYWSSTLTESPVSAFILYYVGQWSFFAGSGFMASLVVVGILFPIVRQNSEMYLADWRQSSSSARIWYFIALISGLLFFLGSVVPHSK